jgi:plastocyanin
MNIFGLFGRFSILARFWVWMGCATVPGVANSLAARVVVLTIGSAITLIAPIGIALAATGPFRIVVIDSKGEPVRDAVVMLRPAKSNTSVRPRLVVSPDAVVIQQLDREFVPRVTVVPVGAKVSFPNKDSVPHSVYSFSAAKQFEFEVYVGESPKVLTLDKPGIITLGCNIHDWMVAYIAVVDTPHALATDARGVATLANVADGDYELRVWHPQQKSGEYATAVTASDTVRAHTVNVDVSPPRARYKPPTTIKQY